MLTAMQRLYTRDQYLERVSWMKSAKRDISITSDIIVGFPGETEEDLAETLSLLNEVGYDAVFAFKYSPRPNTPSLALEDAIPDEEKIRRLEVVNHRQRTIQTASYNRYIGTTCEVMVEGRNDVRSQWMGRTSQNKTLNFTADESSAPEIKIGNYLPVRITASFPNSLLGQLVI
jgi:tRNA-2-methylthio-N6-dimethylallyladenosine synthase